MDLTQDARRFRVPLAVKIPFTVFVCVLTPVYWKYYGPANFLSFCDAGLLLTGVAMWLNSPLLMGMCAVALVLPQTAWILDLLAHGRLIGVAGYMFKPQLPMLTRGLSTFHIWLPFVLIILVWKMGYDRRAFWFQCLFLGVLFIASYALTDPRHPPAGYPDAAVNVNRVFGPSETHVQTAMPPAIYLTLELLFFWILFYLPTHLVLRGVFRRPSLAKHDSAAAVAAPGAAGQ